LAVINVTDRANIAMRLVPLKLSFRHLLSTLCAGTGSCFDRLTETSWTRSVSVCIRRSGPG
ncbi:hypothetical protein, partial [Dongia sedimenti]|nr:hypothetical protein [Rhodospirillaceae bacterium R-7]